jgi:adenylosuccinate lyase
MSLSPQGTCPHERSHIVDSRFFGAHYSTAASHRIFCDRCRFQRWLDVEAALALSQGELGIIPSDAALAIAAAARFDALDLDAVQAEITRTGHSLVGLLRVFQVACKGRAGEYVHYGATTQDIQDTAQSLEIRDVLAELDRILRSIVSRLVELADEQAASVALGRTHAQPALPLSFGLKVASWTDELLRHGARVESIQPVVQAAQLFGGVGTMAGFGDRGPELVRRFAERLGLSAPTVAWHVARDRVVEYVSTLAMVAGTMGRIADEVRTLSRPEFGEVEEQWRPGVVGSSTMPHKRNPETCQQVVVMARLAAAQVAVALAGMGGDHERDSRALRLEWVCVADVAHYCLAGCEITRSILDGLTVHADRLLANVRDAADQVATENLMLALGAHVGKQTAHGLLYELSQAARSQGRRVRDLVDGDPRIAEHIGPEDLDRIFDPSSYIGQSVQLTRAVIAEAQRWLAASALRDLVGAGVSR